MPTGTISVDRTTRWGNPFNGTQSYLAVGASLPLPLIKLQAPPSVERCVDMYAAYLVGRLVAEPEFLAPLRGKNLMCWCALDKPCHADVLLRLANEQERHA